MASTPPAIRHAIPRLKHHHGGVSVPDLDQAIEWYGRVLGFAVEARFPIPQIPAEVAMLRRDDMRMELFQPAEDKAKPMSDERRVPDLDVHTYGNKHVAFAVPDIPRTVEALRRQQVDIVFVKEFPWGSNAFVRDPFGNLIEFVLQADLWEGGA